MLSGCFNNKPAGDGSSWNIVKNRGIIVVGISRDLFPISYIGKNDEFSGFAVDLLKEASARLGLQVSFKNLAYKDAITALNEGRVDMVLAPEGDINSHDAEIDFVETFIVERQIIAVRQNAAILNKGDLSGRVIEILSDGEMSLPEIIYSERIDYLDAIDFSNTEQALDELMKGKIDAVIGSETKIRYYAAKQYNEIVILNEVLDTKKYSACFKKEDKALSDKIKKTLYRMRKDGSFYSISANWFGIGLP